jgi:hypothetical protein
MRAHSNILCISAPIGQPKHFITDFEFALCTRRNTLDDAGEFDAQDWTGLGWEWVMAFALEEVHAIQAEGFDLYYGVCILCCGLRDFGIDEEL